jgi:hypothetical protein
VRELEEQMSAMAVYPEEVDEDLMVTIDYLPPPAPAADADRRVQLAEVRTPPWLGAGLISVLWVSLS